LHVLDTTGKCGN